MLWLPKFRFETKYDLNKPSISLGMEKAFEGSEADFPGMDGRRGLFIASVLHQAFVYVNEEGAAVGIRMSAAPRYKAFRADHPFMFFIMKDDAIVHGQGRQASVICLVEIA